jgi:hypothetical protein
MVILSCFFPAKRDEAQIPGPSNQYPSLQTQEEKHFPTQKHVLEQPTSSSTVLSAACSSTGGKTSLEQHESPFLRSYIQLEAQHGSDDWGRLKLLSPATIAGSSEFCDVSAIAILEPNLFSQSELGGMRDIRCVYVSPTLKANLGISLPNLYSQLLVDAIYAGDEVLGFVLDRAIQALRHQSSMKDNRKRKCIVTAPGPLEGMLLELELCRWISDKPEMGWQQQRLQQEAPRNAQPALLIHHIPLHSVQPQASSVPPTSGSMDAQTLAAGVTGTLPAVITLCDLEGRVLYQVG